MSNLNSNEKSVDTPITQDTTKKVKRAYNRKKPYTDVFVEFSGNQLSQDDLVEKAKSVMVTLGKEADGVKKFVFYIQPNNRAIYFTADGNGNGEYFIPID